MFKTHTSLLSPLARFLSLVCYCCHDILFLAAKKYATLFVYFGGVFVGFLRSFLCFLLCDKDRNAHKQTLRTERQRDSETTATATTTNTKRNERNERRRQTKLCRC